jgi:hypothetical protein
MLTQMDVINASGGTLQLPLASSAGGYVVKEIDGLDPVTATLTSSSLAQVDGAQLNAASRGTRNITAKFGFAPDYSASSVKSLRKNLYKYMLPKSNITMKFYDNGTLNAITTGTVESLAAPSSFFVQDPEMDLSVICFDPDFYAPDSETVTGATIAPSTSTPSAITYEGDSAAGFIFTLNINGAPTTISLYNVQPDGTSQLFEMDNLSLASGDVVTINTIPFQKAVTRNRAGTVTSLLYTKSQQSVWPSLVTGVNNIRCTSDLAAIPWSLNYTAKFAGL